MYLIGQVFFTVTGMCLILQSHGTRAQDESDSYSHRIFEDYFNTSGTYNPSVWNVPNTTVTEDNKEPLHFCVPENVYVENDFLHIKANHSAYVTRNYTSGMVSTQHTFSFKYGEIEWRAKVASGRGLRSVLWLRPHNCDPGWCPDDPLSIIVMDFRGQVLETHVSVSRNDPITREPESNSKTVNHPSDVSLGFHVFKLVWLPTKLTWFVDAVEVFNVTDPKMIPAVEMQVNMKLEVGGKFPGPPDSSTIFPAEFLIDYVVVRGNKNYPVISPLIIAVVTVGSILAGVSVIMGRWYYIRKRRAAVMSQESNWGNLGDYNSKEQDASVDPCFHFLEIPIMHLQKTSELLGKGQFGSVWKGLLKNKKASDGKLHTVVAIKTLLDCADNQKEIQRQLFLEEMKIMIKVGRHLNIVNLLGTVTIGKPTLMVLEFCPHGSLLKYLHKNRDNFVNTVNADGLLVAKSDCHKNFCVKENDYLNDAFIPKQIADTTELSTDDLINITFQITRGLEYLTARSVIHRDMAARNVLVCENKIVKISDFGLARERILTDYLLQNHQIALPIKWMAPESILEKTFSHQSDIWSLGVLMWEIFSLGESPYSADDGSGFTGPIVEFARAITRGLKMQRPKYAPVFMYDLMLRCWNKDKEARPSASLLRAELSNHLTEEPALYFELLNEPHQTYNRIYTALLDELANDERPYH